MARDRKQRERKDEPPGDESEAETHGGNLQNYPGPRPDEWRPEKGGEGPDLGEERAPNRPSGKSRKNARPKGRGDADTD